MTAPGIGGRRFTARTGVVDAEYAALRDVLARLGGDEFGLLLPDCNLKALVLSLHALSVP